ncbi:LuxR family transcriptional regulator [Mycobacterium koreense]|uniref:LuxR family transcriptional regulator n=1 Tax=Mycolicibacillus koreensis TaxID=1069220 RepID=A0A7I7SGM8_9MYCO|nr:LuxR family transcriptional regulator [Mycolicibacillus koreensis]MCV7248619.1 LuxR family transcriptional regulator [Mycolicibacillus koreensis]ODR11857.1 LuxR family transcriptional regulator [Mycolicibacillus koreensis]OSC34024.1 LuxR family transcriptional regulator [Mycolicibacillus koreensis]BBY55581.1 LuxR family transcriptional regulator [Mycolicibacillus koreensis]
MNKFSLTAMARDQLERARTEASGRRAATVFGGHDHTLRQTVIALVKGRTLDDHQTLDDATLQVLTGRVRLSAGRDEWIGWVGDLLVIPDAVHALEALEDSAILLTVAKKTE